MNEFVETNAMASHDRGVRYRQRHREALRESSRERYRKNIEKEKDRARKYRKNNHDAILKRERVRDATVKRKEDY